MEHLKLTHILGRKVLFYILLCSSLLTILVTIAQLYMDYSYDVSEIEQRFEAIESGHLDALAVNLWDFQDKAVQQQLTGIESLPNIQFVQLTTPQGTSYVAGFPVQGELKKRNFKVIYKGNEIGTLSIEASYEKIYEKLINKAAIILLTQFVKTMLAALCIVAIVYWIVTRHVYRIAEFGRDFNVANIEKELILVGDRKHQDELDELVESVNFMRLTLKSELQRRQKAEDELTHFNHQLEVKVEDRTRQLQETIEQLKDAQTELIRSEKMAALGQLVAGIAHEINTPLGISVTANSVVADDVSRIKSALSDKKLSKSQLEAFFTELEQTNDILDRNLNRAVELIKSFKSVAVNQSNDSLLECPMEVLVKDIIGTVQTMFKAKQYQINLNIEPDLIITTYPGAWTQILTNLLMNSHIHGFEHNLKGNIQIDVKSHEDKLYFTYQDDGSGIPEEILEKVFDPFVTTKRGNGGSGLGLNILFNLVYEQLKGRVTVSNLDRGCVFEIVCPLTLQS